MKLLVNNYAQKSDIKVFSIVRWTLDLGLAWVAFTYGFVSALGQGIALIPTMTIGMRSVVNTSQSETTPLDNYFPVQLCTLCDHGPLALLN